MGNDPHASKPSFGERSKIPLMLAINLVLNPQTPPKLEIEIRSRNGVKSQVSGFDGFIEYIVFICNTPFVEKPITRPDPRYLKIPDISSGVFVPC